MYSGDKYLVMPIIDYLAVDNNQHSGGLPHSEIHGSKLILSSPWLNAEYHVLHRLLLPRHPPNALIALDLIRKKTDLNLSAPPFVKGAVASDQKHVLFPLPSFEGSFVLHMKEEQLVSVLDLDNVIV